jgi:hypothetical protein
VEESPQLLCLLSTSILHRLSLKLIHTPRALSLCICLRCSCFWVALVKAIEYNAGVDGLDSYHLKCSFDELFGKGALLGFLKEAKEVLFLEYDEILLLLKLYT